MKPYSEIHIWDFPPTETYLKIEEKFRKKLIWDFIYSFSSWQNAIDFINNKSENYGLKKNLSRGALSHWSQGIERTRGKSRYIHPFQNS